MLYKFQQPGIYAYVNHNLIEAVMLGATAHVVVDGEWNDDLMMQVAKARAYYLINKWELLEVRCWEINGSESHRGITPTTAIGLCR